MVLAIRIPVLAPVFGYPQQALYGVLSGIGSVIPSLCDQMFRAVFITLGFLFLLVSEVNSAPQPVTLVLNWTAR